MLTARAEHRAARKASEGWPMSLDSAARLEVMLARIPYARLLGVHVQLVGDEMTAFMPYADHLIGNPISPPCTAARSAR